MYNIIAYCTNQGWIIPGNWSGIAYNTYYIILGINTYCIIGPGVYIITYITATYRFRYISYIPVYGYRRRGVHGGTTDVRKRSLTPGPRRHSKLALTLSATDAMREHTQKLRYTLRGRAWTLLWASPSHSCGRRAGRTRGRYVTVGIVTVGIILLTLIPDSWYCV